MTKNELPEYESDLYSMEGSDYLEAWEIMREKMEVPPSLEGFIHGYIHDDYESPQQYARQLLIKSK